MMAKRTSTITTVSVIVLMLSNTQVSLAQNIDNDFRETMQGLLANVQGVVEGIIKEDFEQIRGMAEDIAFHPSPPPNRRMAIANELGIEMLTFKMFDDSLRQSALKLKQAADKKNAQQVINSYTQVIENCMACHNNYRKQLRNIRK